MAWKAIQKRLRALSCRVFGHEWATTGINGFGHPSEEKCLKCLEYRHRIHDHRTIGREDWKAGKHPKLK